MGGGISGILEFMFISGSVVGILYGEEVGGSQQCQLSIIKINK